MLIHLYPHKKRRVPSSNMGNSALSSVFKSDMSKNFSGPSPFCIKPDHPPDICVEHFKYPATFLAFTASMPSALVTSNAASMTISFVTLTFFGGACLPLKQILYPTTGTTFAISTFLAFSSVSWVSS